MVQSDMRDMYNVTKVQYLVMCCLTVRPMHIYAIRQGVIGLTDHGYWPTHNTLKKAVGVLIKKGLVEECGSDPYYWLRARRGKPYELTKRGRQRLYQETAMYFQICQIVRIRKQLREENQPAPLFPTGR